MSQSAYLIKKEYKVKERMQMRTILECNEEAFRKRYGVSLQKIWSGLTEEQQDIYMSENRIQISSDIAEVAEFKSYDILRIIIGYVNKKQLEDVVAGCTSVVRILLWEPDEATFAAGCIYEDIADYINDERILIVIGNDEDTLKNGMEKVVHENNILHRHICAYGKYNVPGDKDGMTFIKVFYRYFIDMFSEMGFRKQYEHLVYENALCAINAINDNSTTTQFFNAIPVRDIPVIIVAAGPSLMKNCTELKRAKNRAVIVAVTHSMSTLADNGVSPDIVAVTEPRNHYFPDSDEEKGRILLCCVYASKEFQEAYMGKLVYYGFGMFENCFSVKRTREEIFTDEETGSIATDMLSLFIAGGFRNFILVGQDLAYAEDGISHADGKREILENNQDGSFPETEGIYGGTVKTRDDWMVFKQYYEKRIQEDNTLNIIDATEGGALIHGTRVMKLKDAIDYYCIKDYPVDEWLSNIPKGDEDERKQIDEWFEQLSEMNQRVSENLERIISLNEEISVKWNKEEEWDDDFSAKCRKYDVIYHVIMEGDDGIHIREYCRADLERYIEEALIYEGDDNIEARMKREHELFITLKEKLENMQDYIRTIRNEKTIHVSS